MTVGHLGGKMKKFAHGIVKFHKVILCIALLLLIPSAIGAVSTRINYDILTYLPQNLDSMIGEKYLEDDFHLASSAMVTVEDMPTAQLLDLKERIGNVKGVSEVFWLSDVLDVTVDPNMLPDELHDFLFDANGDATMMIVKFSDTAASESTMNAIAKIKTICSEEAYIGGMSIILQDTKALVDQELPIYIGIAIIACIVVLLLGVKATILPFLFMLGLLFPIVYNFGTNIFYGQISYITEALATVLQLGVTMDYSIFLVNRWQEDRQKAKDDFEAMENAIVNTASSISASSLTTIAGFLALCFMRLTLGRDIGLVMAKGVVLGVLSTITILPALILVFRKYIYKWQHRTWIPSFKKTSTFVTKHYKTIPIVFLCIFSIFALAYPRVQQYYTLTDSLPDTLTGKIGNEKLKEDFGMTSSYFVIIDDNLVDDDVKKMCEEIENLDDITSCLSLEKFLGSSIPSDMLPAKINETFVSNGHELIMINSSLAAGTDEINKQITDLTKIIKKYDARAVVTGESPMTKDLIDIASVDFNVVNWISIIFVFVIIALSFQSISIPILLVATIEAAIIINMAIPYFTNTTIPFIASIVIGTIQLGATVDYAILMTTRFKEELKNGHTRKEAAKISVATCSQSILTSALTFFCATIGVSIVSKMELLQSICLLIARGAIISMLIILFVLPCLLILFEPIIHKTTLHWPTAYKEETK